LPFGVSGVTTWLNLMTMGDCCAAAPQGDVANDAAPMAKAISNDWIFMFPPKSVDEWASLRDATPTSPGGPALIVLFADDRRHLR
jgi:hypothetical protein